MCNRYGYLHPLNVMAAEFEAWKVNVQFAPDTEGWTRDDIRPTNNAMILRPTDPAEPTAGLEASLARWWLVPFFHRKPVKDWKAMCTNARHETVHEAASWKGAYARRRCLVPMSRFYEWTGDKGDKTKWMITPADGKPHFFAGLWDTGGEDSTGPSFGFVTSAAGDDMGNYHSRQPIVLDAERGLEWLRLDGSGRDALQPDPRGSLVVELAPPEAKAETPEPAAP